MLVFSLLMILSFLKIIFYNYNYHIIFSASDADNTWKDWFQISKWSLAYDFFILILINNTFLVILQLARMIAGKWLSNIILLFFILLNSSVILLNLSDIFYFRFHFQRANADLLYVLNNPFKTLFHMHVLIIAGFFLAIGGALFLNWKLYQRFLNSFQSGKRCRLATVIIILGILLFPFYKKDAEKYMVPTYPLVELNSKQLMVAQNSFHTFVFSVFRSGEEVKLYDYMSTPMCDSIYPIRKIIPPEGAVSGHKNIVLFIMESVPYDFFDTRSPYKVEMPFFDSLLQKSCFYDNAFCYAHQSNKGITAILAGLPTLSDIPLYHSSFVSMPITTVGTALQKNNYHSFFCIGDDFDNFGFAKCIHWLGIENYYCKEDLPNYKNLPAHSMGIHDEYVLDFMHNRINDIAPPFFAVNYNISTHYPYDLPASYRKSFTPGYTSPMKGMSYYDFSLQKFFDKASKEKWFNNTVFIFCSDHWMAPDDNNIKFNAISGYRIPIIVYDPSVPKKKTDHHICSQFDVMGTILAISGYRDSIISYGRRLPDSNYAGGYIFSRPNASLYQVCDTGYVLGFNPNNQKTEFLYHYSKDSSLKENVLLNPAYVAIRDMMTKKILAFLQKASMQYYGIGFK